MTHNNDEKDEFKKDTPEEPTRIDENLESLVDDIKDTLRGIRDFSKSLTKVQKDLKGLKLERFLRNIKNKIKNKIISLMDEKGIEILTIERKYLAEFINKDFLEYHQKRDNLPRIKKELCLYLLDNGIDISYKSSLINFKKLRILPPKPKLPPKLPSHRNIFYDQRVLKKKLEIKNKIISLMDKKGIEILTIERKYLPEFINKDFLEYHQKYYNLPIINKELGIYLRDNGIDISYKSSLISFKKLHSERKKVKDIKDGPYLITYTRHLEKRLRNLETEKQLLDAERFRLEQELQHLRNVIDKLRARISKKKSS